MTDVAANHDLWDSDRSIPKWSLSWPSLRLGSRRTGPEPEEFRAGLPHMMRKRIPLADRRFVRFPGTSRAFPALLFVIAALAVSGCSSTGTAVGSAISAASTAGVASGVTHATGSALVGTAAGIGAGIGLDAGIKYVERRIHHTAQDAVAHAAGPLAVGQSARWNIDQWLPLTDRHGTVEIARSFGSAIPCKDAVFTVDDDDNLYVTTVCRDKRGIWRWALAEPTTDRWGSLQ